MSSVLAQLALQLQNLQSLHKLTRIRVTRKSMSSVYKILMLNYKPVAQLVILMQKKKHKRCVISTCSYLSSPTQNNMKNHKYSKTATYVVLGLIIVAGLIIVTLHHKKPEYLVSNTPTNISLGGVYSITSPCLAYTSKLSNTGGYDPTEYFASCDTNKPNNLVVAGSDTAPGLPPGINYTFYSYSTYKNIDAPQPSLCDGDSFTQSIYGTTFYICEQSQKVQFTKYLHWPLTE